MAYRFINDRSDLDGKIAYQPQTKTYVTLREDLVRSSCPRTDVVLINATRSGKEYTLHVTDCGFAGDAWILDILTPEEFNEVQRIASIMRMNAKMFPPAKKLLVPYSVTLRFGNAG